MAVFWIRLSQSGAHTGTTSDSVFHRAHKLRYRADIDGLRALAVLLVVFQHLRTRITGGYIGVDIFFCDLGIPDQRNHAV